MTRIAPAAPRWARLLLTFLAVVLLAEVVTTATGNADHQWLRWLSTVVIAGAGVCLVLRARLTGEDRLAWTLLGAACLTWAGAEVIYDLWYARLRVLPIPSVADVLWFSYYPLTIAGVSLLVRARIGRVPGSYWLDAAVGVATAGAVAAVVSADLVRAAVDGAPSAVATLVNAGYPTGDFVTLLLIVGAMILCRARLNAGWLLLAAAQVLCIVADTSYLLALNSGTFSSNGLLNIGYAAGAMLLALAAWQHEPRRTESGTVGERWSALLLCAVFGSVSLCLLVIDHFDRIPGASVALATFALVLLIVRFAMVFRDNLSLVDVKHREAMTDALTGLGNRRALLRDLEQAATPGAPPAVLILFDLDGFKGYNDGFGHPAGDALLTRLGGRLAELARALGGNAYRLGGDEFCALVGLGRHSADEIARRAAATLREQGDGFSIGASWGAVELPCEGGVSAALRTADRRMYAQKSGDRPSATQQTLDVLKAATRERRPDLGDHVHGVAELAEAIGSRLGLEDRALDRLRLGAELHDVGKIAIPDAILYKPGPLDEAEWAFMRRHTLLGERILLAARDLADVAQLVRSSHERYDGGGYPDGLEGETIPLGARIIAVCDSFDAMITRRPYSEPMSSDGAITELRRCAGSQFDPLVVSALVEVMRGRRDTLATAST